MYNIQHTYTYTNACYHLTVLIPSEFLLSLVGVPCPPLLLVPLNIPVSIFPQALSRVCLALSWLLPAAPLFLLLLDLLSPVFSLLLGAELNTDCVFISSLFFLFSSLELPLMKSVLFAVLMSSECSSTRGMNRLALSLNFVSSSSFSFSCFFSS